jgi:hypothetical protein
MYKCQVRYVVSSTMQRERTLPEFYISWYDIHAIEVEHPACCGAHLLYEIPGE